MCLSYLSNLISTILDSFIGKLSLVCVLECIGKWYRWSWWLYSGYGYSIWLTKHLELSSVFFSLQFALKEVCLTPLGPCIFLVNYSKICICCYLFCLCSLCIAHASIECTYYFILLKKKLLVSFSYAIRNIIFVFGPSLKANRSAEMCACLANYF